MVDHEDHDKRTLASIGVQEMSLQCAPDAPDHEFIVYTVLKGAQKEVCGFLIMRS